MAELSLEMHIIFAIIAAVFGLCVGSFLNVVALRSLKDEEFVLTPSHCFECGKNLNWYNNIPVLSYLFQRGKCQFCKCKISPQYPIVESICGALFLFTYLEFGLTLKSLFLVVLFAFFILISITDFRERVVYNWHTYPIIVLGLLYSVFVTGGGVAGFESGIFWPAVLKSVIGIAVGFVFFEVTARLGYLFADSRAFGEGDTVIAMGLGAFFGWKWLLVIILMAIFLQAAFTIPLMFWRAFKARDFEMCSALILIVMSLGAIKCFEIFDLYSNLYKIIPFLIIVAIALAWCLKVLLTSMKKKKKEDLFLLPFGPALVICATAVVFFGSEILKLSGVL